MANDLPPELQGYLIATPYISNSGWPQGPWTNPYDMLAWPLPSLGPKVPRRPHFQLLLFKERPQGRKPSAFIS